MAESEIIKKVHPKITISFPKKKLQINIRACQKTECEHYKLCLDLAVKQNKKELPCQICKKYKKEHKETNILPCSHDYDPLASLNLNITAT